jgi:hypothetical protein
VGADLVLTKEHVVAGGEPTGLHRSFQFMCIDGLTGRSRAVPFLDGFRLVRRIVSPQHG